MPRRFARLSVSTLLAGALAACGSGSSSTGASGGGGHAPVGAPKEHRAAEAPCTAARPPGPNGSAEPGGSCSMDADCTKGTNGRCAGNINTPNSCSYDACAADKDCGSATICECRNPASFDANTCVHGSCRLDADCGSGGFCSPSAVRLDPGCALDIDPGSIGYFCHTQGDTCANDEDCGAQGEAICLFNLQAMRWGCHTLACTG